MKYLQYLLLAAILLLTSQDTLASAEIFTSKYGPNRDQFIQMCDKAISEADTKPIGESSCMIYFMGMRDGYIRGSEATMMRAQLYHILKGEIEPAGELSYDYLSKLSKHTRENGMSPADAKMMEHELRCIWNEDALKLLNDFLEYMKARKKRWGTAVYFNEYAIRNFSGKC